MTAPPPRESFIIVPQKYCEFNLKCSLLKRNFENAKVKPPNQKFFVFFVRNGGFFGHLCYNVVKRE
jgi:hypothetical protein